MSRPGDALERAADRVADAVMASERPARGFPTSPHQGEAAAVRCTTDAALDIGSGAVMGGAGATLPSTERRFFESRFGRDFGAVRLHTDAHAAEAARVLRAHAFTVGADIVFAAGRFAPGTSAGRRLLAHELAHVVQQQRGALGIQRQADTRTGPVPGVSPEPDFDCRIDLQAGRLQDAINCCARLPLLGRKCSDSLRELLDRLRRGPRPGPAPAPPGPTCPGRETPFGTCCPVGEQWLGDRCGPAPPLPLCVPLTRQRPDGGCCPLGERFDVLRRACIRPIEPPPLPPPPPEALAIGFQFDRPSLGAVGSEAVSRVLTAQGQTAFAGLVAQLRADPTLRVQLVGRTSPEGDEAYNFALGARRAQQIARALESEGIDTSRIVDPVQNDLRAECQAIAVGQVSCGEAGGSGPEDRQTLARLFRAP